MGFRVKTAGHQVQREADKAGRVQGEEVCSYELGATGFFCWHQCEGQQATSSCSHGEVGLEGPQERFRPLWR